MSQNILNNDSNLTIDLPDYDLTKEIDAPFGNQNFGRFELKYI